MRRLLACSVLAAALSQGGCATVKPSGVADEPRTIEVAPPKETVVSAPSVVPTAKEKRSSGLITRAELVAVLDAAPGHFLAHVDTEPSFLSGRFHGWMLASFFPGDARFEAVDLAPGDVVLSVNGRSIERPDQLMQVWDALRRERALIVVVERGGVPRQLRYEIID